ncbi:MAG: sodium:proton antiporter, partial [Alphaproteobacteria bacterium]|nr:sodium:proton antiporter [Alphaproteobacteria bacterium]
MELHTSGLLYTMVVSLVAAFAGGLAVRSINLPPLLGYLLAGVMLGPFTPGIVANQELASELAEIGVALLMFNIGLHFSVRDLLAVRRIALWGASIQMLVTAGLGFGVAFYLFGRPPNTALLYGLAVAIASTAVSTRLLEERHQLATFTGHIALGWLVVQDLVVILALVLFPTFSKTENLTSEHFITTLSQTVLQVIGFGVIMFFGGRKGIPRLLGYVARVGSRELFTLAVIVVALGIAYGSSLLFGVSLALGAFFAGIAIGESDLNHHAAAEALSMQQVFTILFFVSVGMLFDPLSILKFPYEIILLLGVILFGMGLATTVILIFLRVPMAAAGLVGAAFSQIGEFSFVLSQLGYSWDLLEKSDRDLILAVALLSLVINPFIVFLFPRLTRALGHWPLIARWQKEGDAHLPGQASQPLVDHAILVGHGRVGKIIAASLKTHDIPYLTIEADRRLMERLRHENSSVIFGDASREAVLTAAHPETARLLIVAIPDGPQARRIVHQA